MEEQEASTRQRILDSAVKLLFATPPAELTTRRISEAANVNVAAINYHFRSKDELIDKAVEAGSAAAFEKGMTVLFAPDKPPAERLRAFLSGYAYGLMKFPGLTRTAFLALFFKEGGDTFYGRYMKEMLLKLGQVIQEVRDQGGAGEEAPDIRDRALMALSCVIFPFLVSGTVRDAGGVDFANDDARGRYIDTMLAVVAGAEKPATEESDGE